MGKRQESRVTEFEMKSITGKRIKKLRERAGLSQAELAHEMKISQALVSHYERSDQGRLPTTENIIKLARILRTSSDYLLGLEDIDLESGEKTQCGRCKRVLGKLYGIRSVAKVISGELSDLEKMTDQGKNKA